MKYTTSKEWELKEKHALVDYLSGLMFESNWDAALETATVLLGTAQCDHPEGAIQEDHFNFRDGSYDTRQICTHCLAVVEPVSEEIPHEVDLKY